ncbi:hypothetical protein HK104_008509 [Borealophlyctis nickersoniae]|nr:hypothetical protein HK104_008509 [Borealophlyctis nickersoniae]
MHFARTFRHGGIQGCRLPRPRPCTATPVSSRLFTVTAPVLASPTTVLVARLRKETGCSIAKAREAIRETETSTVGAADDLYALALQWLEVDSSASASKKAAKLGSRTAREGLVGVCVMDSSAAIFEVNSETDFVSRSPDFSALCERIGATIAVLGGDGAMSAEMAAQKSALAPVDIEAILEAPLLPAASQAADAADLEVRSVREAIVETVGKLGENIQLRRAKVTHGGEGSVVGAYVHGDSKLPKGLGRIGGLVILRVRPVSLLGGESAEALSKLARRLAQQVVGFKPAVLRESDFKEAERVPDEGETMEEFLDRLVLLRQPYVGGGTVADGVANVGKEIGGVVEVASFVRFECGEGIEKKEDNFAEEVMKQAGLA